MEMGEKEKEGVLQRGRLKTVAGWENQEEKNNGMWFFGDWEKALQIKVVFILLILEEYGCIIFR